MKISIGAASLLLASLFRQASPLPPPEMRTVSLVVLDEKGAPVTGLHPEEVAVLEDGVARDVASCESDTRPLALALLVDTSEAVGSEYRLELLGPLSRFLERLPEKTQFSVWTMGDRPTRLVDFTDDATLAINALKRVYPQGGNTLLDAIVEASRDLKKKEGDRSAVVIVTGLGVDTSNRDYHRTVDESRGNATWFMAVEFEDGPTNFETRTEYEFTLDALTKKTGGVYHRTLMANGTSQGLDKISSALRSSYRIRYAAAGRRAKKVEVKVARPGIRVLIGSGQAGS